MTLRKRFMPKILKFSRFSLRDLLITAGPTILIIALACGVAYWLVDPSPPSTITISTGQENSAYQAFAARYAKVLAKQGVGIRFKASLGSEENLRRLEAPDPGVDIAFVQSGSIAPDQAQQHRLLSLGSLFTEPVWLFYREPRHIARLTQLKGLSINVGPEGTGVPRLVRQLLDVNGFEAGDVTLGSLENTPATMALLAAQIDGLVFSSAPDAPLIQMLLQTPGIKLFNFTQAEAYSRRFPYLTHVVLPRGIVDLGRDLPAEDYHLIAPTATLVARADLHPALIDLLVQAAAEIHGGAGWFSKRGDFPTASYTEIPVAPEAEKFYKSGPPLLQRYLPFWLANFSERMWVVVVALGALILPLSRIVPPLYVWRIRSRVYRWYGKLRIVEQAIEEVPPERRAEVYAAQMQRLEEIEESVNRISIPLSFAEGLYELRSHIEFVRKRLLVLMRGSDGA